MKKKSFLKTMLRRLVGKRETGPGKTDRMRLSREKVLSLLAILGPLLVQLGLLDQQQAESLGDAVQGLWGAFAELGPLFQLIGALWWSFRDREEKDHG